MKMRYVMVVSLMGIVMVLDATPKTVSVKNGSKKIRLQVQTATLEYTGVITPYVIKGQADYILEPNQVKNIVILNGPGSYTFVITFVGLERGGYATLPVEIKPNTTGVVIDDAWEIKQYNYIAAYIKQMDTPEPEVHGGSW
ncbi:MAG: hypothetical protein ACHQVS_03770 [Candidatus Babeliales bacterium]